MRLTCGPPADTSGGHALGTVIVIPDGPPAATVVGAVVGAMMGFPVGTVVGIPVGNVVGIPVGTVVGFPGVAPAVLVSEPTTLIIRTLIPASGSMLT